jgi:hypothetical protein
MFSNTKLSFVSGQLSLCDRIQSLLRPWVIPIDGAAVNDTWELSASISKLIANWGECESNMEIFSADTHKVVVDLISVITLFSFSSSVTNFIANSNFLISWEEIWNLTTVKQVVDILKERFFNNLCVREQKYLWLVIKS